jgi:hypothetical protein
MNQEQVPRLLVDVVGRLIYLRRLSKAATSGYERTTDPRQRVRCNDVAAHVAERLQRENSPYFRRDLTQALEAIGWRSVNTDNVRSWKGVVAK